MAEERIRPVDAVRMAEDAAASLAIAGVVEAAKAPLLARIEELEAEIAEMRRRIQGLL